MTQEKESRAVEHRTPVATSQTYQQAVEKAIQLSQADFEHFWDDILNDSIRHEGEHIMRGPNPSQTARQR